VVIAWRTWILILMVAIAAPASADDLVIAGYGDSLTGANDSKWCGHVEAPHSCDWTHAVPGERTEDGTARLIADLQAATIASETTHITLAWGANDVRRGGFDWEASFSQPLRAAATAARAAGFEPVLIVTLDQYETSPGQNVDECVPFLLFQQKIDAEFSPRIYGLAEEFEPELIVVDLNEAYDALPESVKCPGAWNAGYYRDHVHQTDAGYQFMADEMVAAIVKRSATSVPAVGPLPGVLLSCLLASVGLWKLRRSKGWTPSRSRTRPLRFRPPKPDR